MNDIIMNIIRLPISVENVALTGLCCKASMILGTLYVSHADSSLLKEKYEQPAMTPIRNTGSLEYGFT